MAKQKKTSKQSYNNIKSTHPVLCPDGKYRWVYDVPMLKNPSILMEVYWVLGISFGIVWLFVLLMGGCENHFRPAALWDITRGFIILMAVFFVLGWVAYFFVSWYYGWKYSILFIMDEQEVVHKQLPGTEGKARAIGSGRRKNRHGRNGNTGCQPYINVHQLQQCTTYHSLSPSPSHQSERTFQPQYGFRGR